MAEGTPPLTERRAIRASEAMYAHRFAYEMFVRPIPSGLTIDHLCRVRHCVNPDHLGGRDPPGECSARRYNSRPQEARKTHCPKGHPYSGANLRAYRGGRYCKTCQREGKVLWQTK